MNNQVLLTGGSGFLGKHMAVFLKNKAVDVLAIGRNPCPVPGVHNILVPELTAAQIERVLTENQIKIDAIVHLAAAGVHPNDRNHDTLLQMNTLLPAKLVAIAHKFGAKAMVMAGSSAEYADSKIMQPWDEHAVLQSSKLYGATKAAGGICALSQAALLDMPVAWMRLFNMYGAGELPHRLFPSLLSSLMAEKPVDISAGTQLRDFIYVADVCEALWVTLNALMTKKMVRGPYNVCTGVAHSVKDFARAMADYLGADPDLLRFGALPMRPDDLPYVVGNAAALQAATGWTSTYSLQQGVAHAIESHRAEKAGVC